MPLYEGVDYSGLTEGTKFMIMEGGNIVGEGIVNEVFQHISAKELKKRLLQLTKSKKIVRYWVNFLTIKNQEFAVISAKLADKSASDTPTITRLILFDFFI